MASTFTPIDAATIAALNAGDEKALEQIFRAHYPVLLERATERLKDEPSAAPRLVMATVRELWEERTGFHTTAEIEAFFNEELRHRSSAVRARMGAVRRFEKSEGVKNVTHTTPTADQLWAEIHAALHKPPMDAATAAKLRREHAKHDAAGHIKDVVKERSLKGPIIIGAIGLVAAAAALVWMDRASKETVVNEMLVAAESEAITTKPGQLGSLALGDGSLARLGAESRLVVVPEFGRKYRSVGVSGTGSFTVAPGNAVPFEGRMGDVLTTVGAEGGTVSMRGYEDDAHRIVRADAGAARVRAPGGTRELAAGQSVVITRDGALRDATTDEVAQAFAWVEGNLVLRDVSMQDAVHQFRRWYAMEIGVPDSSVQARRLSLSVPLESSQAALAAVQGGANVQFLWEDNKMVFRDASAAPAKAKARR